jgi:hypothetical protein
MISEARLQVPIVQLVAVVCSETLVEFVKKLFLRPIQIIYDPTSRRYVDGPRSAIYHVPYVNTIPP